MVKARQTFICDALSLTPHPFATLGNVAICKIQLVAIKHGKTSWRGLCHTTTSLPPRFRLRFIFSALFFRVCGEPDVGFCNRKH
jgi:hypothetical protein